MSTIIGLRLKYPLEKSMNLSGFAISNNLGLEQNAQNVISYADLHE